MARKPELRIFLDSNVIFSGLYSSSGPAGDILDQFIDGKISVVISQQVLEEIVRTISLKIPPILPALKVLLENVSLEIIKDPTAEEIKKWRGLINIEDAGILTAAINAAPDYFVTGDGHFYRNANIAAKSGLNIVTPRQFLESAGDVK